jgi:hypothetical protein
VIEQSPLEIWVNCVGRGGSLSVYNLDWEGEAGGLGGGEGEAGGMGGGGGGEWEGEAWSVSIFM